MKLIIHDVGHGMCISLTHGSTAWLWDCGGDGDNRPSVFLPNMGITEIEQFCVTNYDEDHISDLPNLRNNVYIASLSRNKTIDADGLRQLKCRGGRITPAMESLLAMIKEYSVPSNSGTKLPGVGHSIFLNSFGDFGDTNNCSLVTFLNCQGICFVFPGDLEKAGWLHLLKNVSFQEHLAKVDYFVASHHGRENGYCAEVFNFCEPRAVIFSDSNIEYATQEMAATYHQHCSGIEFDGKIRYVLSTRNDGDIWWNWNL